MKVKGMNPIEQHVEKFLLALVALVLLGVLAMQFLTQPNQVDVGNRPVPPQNVYVELQRQAENLDSQLKDANPALPEVRATDLVQRYDLARSQAADSALALTAPLGRGVDIGAATGADMGVAGPSSDKVAPLGVPRSTTPVAASQWGTLDPYAVLAVPEFSAFVPAEQPFDLPSVTIETTFSGTALRDALSESGGVGIPRRFWAATGMQILGLEVERQRRLPDGTWSAPEPATPPPGGSLPTRALADNAGLPELTELVSKATQAANDIQRPMALPTIAGPEWTPPSDRVVTPGSAQITEADRVRRNLERAIAELERLQNVQQNPRQTDPGSRDSRPGGPGVRNTDPGTTGPRTGTPRNQRRIEQLQRDIEGYRQRLRDLGEPDPTTGTTPGTDPGQVFQPNLAPDPRDTRPQNIDPMTGLPTGQPTGQPSGPAPLALLEQQSVQLWSHDVGVQPGDTYRYRTRVVVNNPLFRKGPVLDDQDAALQAAAAQPFARAEWSDWSEPVVVGATEYYFITNADADGTLTGGRAGATVEIFKMFYGFYRKSTLNLSPGEPIEASLRIPDGLFKIDTRVLDAQAAAAAMLGESTGSLPAGLTRASGRLTIRIGSLLLDVAALPVQVKDDLGRSVVVTEAVVREQDGDVVVRNPQAETSGPAYTQANSSSAAASRSTLREPGQPARSPSADLFLPPPAQP
jgi:hypothetical protein